MHIKHNYFEKLPRKQTQKQISNREATNEAKPVGTLEGPYFA